MYRNRLRRTAPAFILITFYGIVQLVPTTVQPAPGTPTRAEAVDLSTVNVSAELDSAHENIARGLDRQSLR